MAKTNAKQEFIGHTQNLKVKCAKITKGDDYSGNQISLEFVSPP